MRAVLRRPWYLASIALSLAAIGVDFGSKRAANLGMVTMAKAAVARHDGASPAFIESMHAQATTAARQADALALISLVVTVAAGACFFFSIQTHESRWDAIPLGLGLVYVALLWLQV